MTVASARAWGTHGHHCEPGHLIRILEEVPDHLGEIVLIGEGQVVDIGADQLGDISAGQQHIPASVRLSLM